MTHIIIIMLFQLNNEQVLNFNICKTKMDDFIYIENEKKEVQTVGYCHEEKKHGTWHEWDSENKLHVGFYQHEEKMKKQPKKISDLDGMCQRV